MSTETLDVLSVSATDAEIIAYLRRSFKFGEFADLAERDAAIAKYCQEYEITVSDAEWQAAGDAFRLEHRLFGVAQTQQWLEAQRITLDEWSEGIKMQLLTKKLKEHLFGEAVDGYYLNNRDNYRQVALSQILVAELPKARELAKALREGKVSFCALALEHSLGKQSQQNGGFMGVRFVAELIPEIASAIATAKEGEIVEPIQTKLGYHLLKVEKWFPSKLTLAAREQIMTAWFDVWLQERG